GRVDEAAVGDVDTHVGDAVVAAAGVEEHQVTRLHVGALHLQPGEELRGGIAGQLHADRMGEHVAHEAAAIEAGGRAVAATHVAHVAQVHRQPDQRLAQVGDRVDVTVDLD